MYFRVMKRRWSYVNKIVVFFTKLKDNLIKLLQMMLIIAVIGGTVYIVKNGINDYKEAKNKYEQIYSTYMANSQKASRITQVKSMYERKKKEWEQTEIATPLAYYIEGGMFFQQLGELAKKYNVADINITPAGKETGFIDGHLRAVSYNLKISGPFVNVFNVLYGMENIKSPAEIKPIKISAIDNGENVTVETTIVLYSLNPPNKYEFVAEPTGRSDPFFNPAMAEKILKTQIEQQQGEQQEATQQQNKQQQNEKQQNGQQSSQNQESNQGQEQQK